MQDSDDTAFNPAPMVAALAQLIDVLHALEETANGWRKYLLDRGWSDERAEQMAGELLAAFQTKMINP